MDGITKRYFVSIFFLATLLTFALISLSYNSIKEKSKKEDIVYIVSTNIETTQENVISETNNETNSVSEVNQDSNKEKLDILQNTNDTVKLDLRKQVQISEEELNYVLDSTGLEGLAAKYIAEADEHNINVIALVAISILESGWGNSKRAQNSNNIFGLEVSRKFKSKEECIEYTTELLDTKYLTKGGRFYRGTTLTDVNYYYCTNKKWDYKVASIMQYIKKSIMGYRDFYQQVSLKQDIKNF